jgi:hydrogenase expression/formation protein HypD
MTARKVSPASIRQTKAVMDEIRRITTRPWNIMEICGGQTHSIMEYGLDQLLPEEISLIHGPGCPVCVTSLELIERALQLAVLPEGIFTSFGDRLRVPGSSSDLFGARAQGADVRVVYSPMDAVKLAQANPEKQVVFFAVGFEPPFPLLLPAFYTLKSLVLKLLDSTSECTGSASLARYFAEPGQPGQSLFGGWSRLCHHGLLAIRTDC